MATVTKTAPVAIDTQVQNFLKSLGSGPNKIAENLTEQKVKGVSGDSHACPIAKIVKKNFKSLKEVCVSDQLQFVYKDEDYIVDLPSAVGKFVEKFDNGDYPNLVK